jgi:hypothetical protein
MTRYAVHNVIGPKLTGYIKREKLEGFLEKRFPRDRFPGAPFDRFDIRVRFWAKFHAMSLKAEQETNDQWEFYAPEMIPEASSSPMHHPQSF